MDQKLRSEMMGWKPLIKLVLKMQSGENDIMNQVIEEGYLYMILIDGDEQDNKNNQKNIWGKQEENVCTENISVNHTIHPLKRSQNLRPIDDEEWESMLRILKSHKRV